MRYRGPRCLLNFEMDVGGFGRGREGERGGGGESLRRRGEVLRRRWMMELWLCWREFGL